MVRARFPLLVSLLLAAGCDRADAPTALGEPMPGVRSALGTWTVTTSADAGAGSLRAAIDAASSGDVITFAPSLAGATIYLSLPLYIHGKRLTIEGPAAGGVTLHGGGSTRVLVVSTFLGTEGWLVLRNATVTGGTAAYGAGIFASGGSLVLEHSTVTGNHTENPGGGESDYGAGIAFHDTDVRLVNSTVSGNSTSDAGYGGGIGMLVYGGAAAGTLALENSTVAFNSARTGGGLYVADGNGAATLPTLTLRNSIVAENAALDRDDCFITSDVVVARLGVNLASDETCGDAGPTHLVAAEPMLGTLAANGGPSRTHALLLGSPAINAGSECLVTVDQRHVARPQPVGGACDIGAYEYDRWVTPAIGVDASATVNAKTGAALVSGTAACAPFGGSVWLYVTLVQAQKVGKVNVEVSASWILQASCFGSGAPWSAFLTPVNGAFQNGAATVRTQTLAPYPAGFLPAAPASHAVKLFWSKG